MKQSICAVTYLVKDYDEAIDFYVNKLGFTLLEDKELTPAKRWIRVAPNGAVECSLLLAKATTEQQIMAVGHQSGDRVSFFLNTDDFTSTYSKMKSKGVEFLEEPRIEKYATVVVFKDLYGNKWDLLQPNE